MKFDITFVCENEARSIGEGTRLYRSMFQFARNRTNKRSITDDFLNTVGNLAPGRARSWEDARSVAGFS